MNKVREAYERMRKARSEFNVAVAKRFKVGTSVHVEHRGHYTEAEVIAQSGERVQVHSVTGREYVVRVQRLKEFYEQ